MTDENDKKDDPEASDKSEKAVDGSAAGGTSQKAIDDLKKGVGLLLRAAKTAAQGAAHRAKDVAHAEKVEKAFKTGASDIQKTFDRLQSDKLEGALKTSLQEIGRAFGNVAETLERELRRDDDDKKDDEDRDKKS